MPPAARPKAARDEVCVKRLGGRQIQKLPDLGRRERRNHHLRGALMKRPTVLVERLHHRQVGADTDEEHPLAHQFTVEGPLQRALEAAVGRYEIGDLVEYHDAAVVGKRGSQQPQSGIPTRELDAGEQLGTGQAGSSRLLGEEPQLVTDGPPGGREEQMWHVGAVDELLDQARLTSEILSSMILTSMRVSCG